MTKKQAEALKFIQSFIEERGFSPSMREITEGLDLSSVSGAHRITHSLREQGKIKFLNQRARTIEIANP